MMSGRFRDPATTSETSTRNIVSASRSSQQSQQGTSNSNTNRSSRPTRQPTQNRPLMDQLRGVDIMAIPPFQPLFRGPVPQLHPFIRYPDSNIVAAPTVHQTYFNYPPGPALAPCIVCQHRQPSNMYIFILNESIQPHQGNNGYVPIPRQFALTEPNYPRPFNIPNIPTANVSNLPIMQYRQGAPLRLDLPFNGLPGQVRPFR